MERHSINLENVQAVERLYDAEAPLYDEDYGDATTLACDAFVMQQIRNEIDLLQKRGNGRIHMLDIGCGTGIIPRSIPEVLQDGIEYQGIDASDGMLAQARRYLPENTDLRQGDMHNMDFVEEGSMDFDVSGYGPFSYSLEPEVLVEEFARTLAENGRLLFMPYTLRLGSRLVTGFSTAHTNDTQKIFYSGRTLQQMLEESGYFTDVEVIGINYLGYFHGALQGAYEARIDNSSLQEERQLMRKLRLRLQNISSAHTIVARIAEEQDILSQFSAQAHANEYPIGSHAPGLDYITREAHLAQLFGVESGMARFMMVKATRTGKPIEN